MIDEVRKKEYVLKSVPEDFAVNEISEVSDGGEGKFSLFRLNKRDLTTFEAVSRLARVWRVGLNDISCAGNKDRQALTSQVCSVKGVRGDVIDATNEEGLFVKFFGVRKEPVHVGELVGNKFRLVVRSVDFVPEIKPDFLNLFGDQRFSRSNAQIGRLLVRRDFFGAVRLVKDEQPALSSKMSVFLEKNDAVGALRVVPRKLLLLFIHAFQSELWNKAALMSDRSSEKKALPVVGFGTIVDDEQTRSVLKEEGVSPRDFVIREFPEISSEGSERLVWAEAAGVQVSGLEPDEFFPQKKKFTIEFMLPKGSYATEFIRQLFEPA